MSLYNCHPYYKLFIILFMYGDNYLRSIQSTQYLQKGNSLELHSYRLNTINSIISIKPSQHLAKLFNKKQKIDLVKIGNNNVKNTKKVKTQQQKNQNLIEGKNKKSIRNNDKISSFINLAISKTLNQRKRQNSIRKNIYPVKDFDLQLFKQQKNQQNIHIKNYKKKNQKSSPNIKNIEVQTNKQKTDYFKCVKVQNTSPNTNKNNQKSKNHHFLKKGTNINNKILSSIIKKKFTNYAQTQQKIYPYNQQFLKQYGNIIPMSFQDVVGKRQMIKMARIFKGISTKDIQIKTPDVKDKKQFKMKKIGMIDEEQHEAVSGWQYQT